MKTEFTNKVTEELKQRGATEETFMELAAAASGIPKGEYEIDTSDDAISCFGMPLSFIRDHKAQVATIMTVEEAEEIDRVKDMKDKDGYMVERVPIPKWDRVSDPRGRKPKAK